MVLPPASWSAIRSSWGVSSSIVVWVPPSQRHSGGGEHDVRAVGPRARTQPLERLDGGTQLLPREGAVARSSKTLSIRQPRAPQLERVQSLRVEAQSLLEVTDELRVSGKQALTPGGTRERPGLSLRGGTRAELGRDGCGGVAPSEPEVPLDELGCRREIDVGYSKVIEEPALMLEALDGA